MVQNASQYPKIFYCRHMQPGTVGYDDGIILLDTDAIKRMVPSGIGKPVYVHHIDDEVDLKTLKENADGYVTESFYNELDGWAWFKFLAVDDKAHEAIKKGWSVSNAHLPNQWGPGGTKNNVAYRREVIDSEYTHLAIVPDPRYEGACIMTPDQYKSYQDTLRKNLAELQNSNPKEKKPMVKFFKTKREEISASDADLDTHIELQNGKSASIREMIAALEANETKTKTVKVNGKDMTVEELTNSFSQLNAKKKMKNGESTMKDPSDDEEVEGDQDLETDDEIGTDKKNKKMKKNKKAKKNADDDEEDDCMNDLEGDEEEEVEEKNKKSKTKKNAKDGDEVEVDDKYFEELKNAHLNPPKRNEAPMQMLSIDGMSLGKKRYGSSNGSGKY